MTARSAKKESITGFEENLAKLESIIGEINKPDLPLEKSIRHFEKGMGLIRRCQEMLHAAEQKVEELTITDERETMVPLEEKETTPR